jgi:lipopolysaccharide transport system ATP-binding protein
MDQNADTLDDVVAFSGIDRHLDSPLKRYSSGMKARLSFGTAICFPADIYVFDEVLSVVDDDFQAQCAAELGKLNAMGRTILFMSHDLDLVVDLCETGMWIERGTLRHMGTIDEVATAYRAGSAHALHQTEGEIASRG